MSSFIEQSQQIRRLLAQGKVRSGLESALGLIASAKSEYEGVQILIYSYQSELTSLNDQYKHIDLDIKNENLTNVEGNAQMSKIGLGIMEVLDQIAENAEKIQF